MTAVGGAPAGASTMTAVKGATGTSAMTAVAASGGGMRQVELSR